MRKKIVAGNWKMNKTVAEARDLGVEAGLRDLGVAIVSPCAEKRVLAECDLGVTEADFALPETGTLGLLSSPDKPRAVSLAPLAEEAVKLLGSSLPATVELRTALEQDLPAVMIDPVQVEQILLNLCINARDAMDGAGKITVGVRLAAQGAAPRCASCHKPADGRYVELAVADTGPGISPQVLERMFEPFFSTKEVGRGSGMGLATVHGIVHEHGGHVVVETSRGQGATFRVLLPALEGEAEAAAPQSPGTQRAKPLRHALEGRVLLVDDMVDSGHTLAAVHRTLPQRWPHIVSCRTAVLWWKACSVFKPDYWVDYLPDNPWICQPFEIYDNLDRSRALQAYLMAIPIVNQAGMRDSIRQFGPDNQTDVIWEDLVDARTVELTANDNTIYNFIWLDTKKGPVVVEVPPGVLGGTETRRFSTWAMSARNFSGSRTRTSTSSSSCFSLYLVAT